MKKSHIANFTAFTKRQLNWTKKQKKKLFEKNKKVTSHPIIGIVIFISVLLLLGLVYLLDGSQAVPLKTSDEVSNPGQFIAERAQKLLKSLTNLGPRVTGSEANELRAVKMLDNEIRKIIADKKPNQFIEHEVFSSSGFYEYKAVEPYVYNNIQVIVVKFEGLLPSHASIVVNAHFDSVPGSPGGMDNGFMCSVMMEIINKMAHVSERFDHDIIFVFNGGEEPGLLGAHGFVTQHRWAQNATLIVNLDAAGVGEKEMMFQTGPNHTWLIKYYSKVPRPHGQCIGDEVFQSGLIPSDTDYKVFKDVGQMFGYDFAIATNGYRHHSRLDGFSHITSRSYQHVGENMYKLIKLLGNAPEITEEDDSHSRMVFYDIFGWFMVRYSENAAITLNFLIATLSIVLALIDFYKILIIKFNDTSRKKMYFLMGASGVILGWILSFGFFYLFALFLDAINYTMSWYNRPWMVLGLYIAPVLIISSLSQILTNKFTDKIHYNVHLAAQLQCHIVRLIWTIILIVGTSLKIRSIYIIEWSIFFNCVVFIIIFSFGLRESDKLWQLLYLIFHIIPTILVLYVGILIYSVFIPIIGRSGASSNPEILIGGVSVFLTLLIFSYLMPVIITLSERPLIIVGVLLSCFILFFIFIFTPIAFPYSENFHAPAPQRYTIYHIGRKFHDVNGKIVKEDSGYYSINHDRNAPHILTNYVQEFERTEQIDKICNTILYCGLPTEYSRNLESLKTGSWIPSDKPLISKEPTLTLNKKENNGSHVQLYFSITGPDRITISFSPKKDCKIIKVSLFDKMPEEVVQWNGRDVYLINYVYGKEEPLALILDLSTPTAWNEPVIDIGITGRFLHNFSTTEAFQTFLNSFPSWTVTTPSLSMFMHLTKTILLRRQGTVYLLLFLHHISLMLWHVLILNKIYESEDSEIIRLRTYQTRYYTTWNFALQIVYFIIALIHGNTKNNKPFWSKIKGFTFVSLVAPCSIFTFWFYYTIYLTRKNDVHPESFDRLFTPYAKHGVHATILLITIFDCIVKDFQLPSFKSALVGMLIYRVCYYSLFLQPYFCTGEWPYKLFAVEGFNYAMTIIGIEYSSSLFVFYIIYSFIKSKKSTSVLHKVQRSNRRNN